MTVLPSYYTWQDGTFVAIASPQTQSILVADSWRTHNGITWGLEDHVQRFLTGLQRRAPHGDHHRIPLATFRTALQNTLSQTARAYPGVDLFPRISAETFQDSWRIILAVRRAPEPRDSTTLWVPDYTDPRTTPTVKGPDIGMMRALVEEVPADDVVLHDGTNVHETTTGALLVWQTPEHLVLCGAEQQLASISAQRIANHAGSRNIAVTVRSVTIDELVSGDYPVWFSNTVHGISPVHTVRSATGETHVVAHPAAAQWQAAWWAMFAV